MLIIDVKYQNQSPTRILLPNDAKTADRLGGAFARDRGGVFCVRFADTWVAAFQVRTRPLGRHAARL